MKMTERGTAALVKQPDGRYRIEVPVDFEFDDETEKEAIEEAFRTVIADRLEELREQREDLRER